MTSEVASEVATGLVVCRDRDALDAARVDSRPRAVVMTMGALHEGHTALMRAARRRVGATGSVVVTIFVNPLQFGPAEDFGKYPRSFADDLERCAREGVDVVFAPSPEQVYPFPPRVRIDPGPLGDELEGAVRPGHFTGVLTVVAKLLHLVDPRIAVFGEKDYQQLVLIRAMVRDLDFPDLEVLGVPTAREPDGLARSSRNRYLSAEQRRAALGLSAALRAAAAAADGGSQAVLSAARSVLEPELDGAPGTGVDYLELRAPDLGPAPESGPARLLVAARFGATRLIDNSVVRLREGR